MAIESQAKLKKVSATPDCLSILIPLFNEEEFIAELLHRVITAPLPEGLERELIVVDDCSTDGSAEIVEAFVQAHSEADIKLIRHQRNQGKGAAIRTALNAATGRYSIIQDSDLEYDPREYPRLLGPLMKGEADVVYGSRFLMTGERRVLYYWHSLANKFLTTLCNIAADVNLTDMETCYKAFRTSFAKLIPIESNRFGIEPELTIKFARLGARIYETSISYHGRSYEEGKKIGLKDAIEAVWVILRFRFGGKLHFDKGPEILDALSVAPRFNRWMADTISPFVGSSVLEIGAGIGNMTRQICPGRNIYFASDVDDEYLERLRNRFQHRPSVHVFKLDAQDCVDFVNLPDKVDTVICLNVLEHLKDDHHALQLILSTLKAGGRLVLLVPNDPAAYGSLDRVLGHFRRYTPETLSAVLVKAGFQVEDILKFNRVSYPGWRFTGQLMRAKTLSPLGMRVFDKLVWLWRKIDRTLPWPATSIIAIARKPADAPA